MIALLDPASVKAIDELAQKGDRWLFIATLVCFALFAWWLFRGMATEIKEQRKISNQQIADLGTISQKCSDRIAENTQQAKETTEALREVVQELTFCRRRNETSKA